MKPTLTEEHLTLMNDIQRKVVLTQWQKHQHETHEVDYDVSGEGDVLEGFIVAEGVWCPFLSSGRYHARYLFYHTSLFHGKTAIEIGSGTGLMGVVMAKHGAGRVILSDISPLAVQNTLANVRKFDLEDKVEVVQGDLFENVNEKGDLILWNIPFFPGKPPERDPISASMIMPPNLLKRFLNDSKEYLNPNGVIVVPSYSLGGDLMNPLLVGEELGYSAERKWIHDSTNGIQRGLLYIDELRLK